MLGKSQAKYIQSLGQKKFRDEEGFFIAEGPKIVEELLQSSRQQIHQVYALSSWITRNESLLHNISAIAVDEKDLPRISQLTSPNIVLAIVKKFETLVVDPRNKVSLVLDTIQDPGNLGTIIRIADWFGIGHIICNHGCVDVYNPKVVQSTMGSIARVNIEYVDLPGWLFRQSGMRIYAAALEGRDVTTMQKIQEGLVMIGNESKGLTAELLDLANVRINIPRKGNAESLNAAVATGIIVSHLV